MWELPLTYFLLLRACDGRPAVHFQPAHAAWNCFPASLWKIWTGILFLTHPQGQSKFAIACSFFHSRTVLIVGRSSVWLIRWLCFPWSVGITRHCLAFVYVAGGRKSFLPVSDEAITWFSATCGFGPDAAMLLAWAVNRPRKQDRSAGNGGRVCLSAVRFGRLGYATLESAAGTGLGALS